jgi:RimJ/RimL family protein N-acetyltransferase
VTDVEIRRIRTGDAELLRDVRLRALAADPTAFAATLEEEEAKPAEWWTEWASEDAAGDEAVTFLAVDGDRAVGIVAAFPFEDEPFDALLVAMWVDPGRRGGGTGYCLVREIQRWAFARGLRSVGLSVAEERAPARGLYRKCGFRETGVTKRLRSNPSIRELEMEWRVEPVG